MYRTPDANAEREENARLLRDIDRYREKLRRSRTVWTVCCFVCSAFGIGLGLYLEPRVHERWRHTRSIKHCIVVEERFIHGYSKILSCDD